MTSSADRCSLTSLDSEDERTWHSLTAVPISPALLDEFITDDSDYWQLDDTDLYKGSKTTPRQGIFQDLEHGGVKLSTNPWGSLPFPSPLPFPFSLPLLPLSPSFPPEAGGCCAKVGGVLTPLRGCGKLPAPRPLALSPRSTTLKWFRNRQSNCHVQIATLYH